MSKVTALNPKQTAKLLRKVADDVERGKCSPRVLRALLKPLTDARRKG